MGIKSKRGEEEREGGERETGSQLWFVVFTLHAAEFSAVRPAGGVFGVSIAFPTTQQTVFFSSSIFLIQVWQIQF